MGPSTVLTQQEGLLELRSTGIAGEHHGSRLGLYELLPDVTGEGGSPVYRQMHDGDIVEHFLYRTDGFWFVGPEAGKAFCIFMKKRVAFKAEQMQPPATGWECIIGKDTFQPDPTMECSRELTPICTEVRVELFGAAKEEHPLYEGSYVPVDGKINRGRWVGFVLKLVTLSFYQDADSK